MLAPLAFGKNVPFALVRGLRSPGPGVRTTTMAKWKTSIALLVAVVGAAGCGGSTLGPGDGGESDAHGYEAGAGTSDGGRDEAAVDAGPDAAGSQCPAAIPKAGSPCDRLGPKTCEYGDDPHCRTRADCSAISDDAFVWTLGTLDVSCVANPLSCPAHFSAALDGVACSEGMTCTYPEGRCSCVSCAPIDGGLREEYRCLAWSTPAGCPEPRPNLGTACTQEGQECAYGPMCCAVVDIGPVMICRNGEWESNNLVCPCIELACKGS
jgi:hypothetical protein